MRARAPPRASRLSETESLTSHRDDGDRGSRCRYRESRGECSGGKKNSRRIRPASSLTLEAATRSVHEARRRRPRRPRRTPQLDKVIDANQPGPPASRAASLRLSSWHPGRPTSQIVSVSVVDRASPVVRLAVRRWWLFLFSPWSTRVRRPMARLPGWFSRLRWRPAQS